MPCSLCKQAGHNKTSCLTKKTAVAKIENALPVVTHIEMSELEKANAEIEKLKAELAAVKKLKACAPKLSADESIPHGIFISAINTQKDKEENNDIWKESAYKQIATLESNNVGNVGESFIQNICTKSKIQATCDGSKTKQLGGGKGDGEILTKVIEVKTARQGSGSSSFQHELGEVPWKSDVMIFVDVAPDSIYLTIFQNFDETTYKSGNKLPVFPTKSVTWRKGVGAFKLDTSVKINMENIEKGHTIKIGSTTPIEDVAAFIRKKLTF